VSLLLRSRNCLGSGSAFRLENDVKTDEISPSFLSLRMGGTTLVARRDLVAIVPAHFLARIVGHWRHFDATALLVRNVIAVLAWCLDHW
jgi:hypothetical protein